jgi:hypothetical protein
MWNWLGGRGSKVIETLWLLRVNRSCQDHDTGIPRASARLSTRHHVAHSCNQLAYSLVPWLEDADLSHLVRTRGPCVARLRRPARSGCSQPRGRGAPLDDSVAAV